MIFFIKISNENDFSCIKVSIKFSLVKILYKKNRVVYNKVINNNNVNAVENKVNDS